MNGNVVLRNQGPRASDGGKSEALSPEGLAAEIW